MVIQGCVDGVDIENRKNHLVSTNLSIAVVVDAYKIMDLLIAKMNYPMVYYHCFVMADKKQSHTFEVIHEDEMVYMDGLNIDETFKSGYEKNTKDK